MPPAVLRQDLDILQNLIHCQQFYLLGGEPLLHPQLSAMLDVVNRSSIGDATCILTNGTLSTRMPEEAWAKVDLFQISVYPDLDPIQIEHADAMGARYNCIVGKRPFDMFCKQFKSDPSGRSFFSCPWKDRCLTIHAGSFFRCPQSALYA